MFSNCKDPALTILKDQGYNVVQFPKADLRPTQLLSRKGNKLQRIGELTTTFIPGATALPSISDDQPGPNISGTKSANIDINVGLSILSGLISALGASTLGLSGSYTQARKIQFEFDTCIENHTEISALDAFLAGASVNPLARAVTDMLNDDDIFVVTSTIRSAKINTIATDSNNAAISLDVPVVQNTVGANVKVTASGAASATVAYQGSVPLAFGYQAVQLIFADGAYRTMRLSDAGSTALEAVQVSSAPVYFKGALGGQ
jgi:hypothetical protein